MQERHGQVSGGQSWAPDAPGRGLNCLDTSSYSQVPGLAVVIVGERKDSQTYVRMKRRACAEVGIRSFECDMPEDSTQQQVLSAVAKFNADPNVHGILVQLPVRGRGRGGGGAGAVGGEQGAGECGGFWGGGQTNGQASFVPQAPAVAVRSVTCQPLHAITLEAMPTVRSPPAYCEPPGHSTLTAPAAAQAHRRGGRPGGDQCGEGRGRLPPPQYWQTGYEGAARAAPCKHTCRRRRPGGGAQQPGQQGSWRRSRACHRA
jgi:hypothetical protein